MHLHFGLVVTQQGPDPKDLILRILTGGVPFGIALDASLVWIVQNTKRYIGLVLDIDFNS